VAKNVVAAGLAERCQLQVAYAIGVAHPMSVLVETFGTEAIPVPKIEALVREHFDLRPAAILRDLDLRRPIYANTATSRGSAPTRPTRCARLRGFRSRQLSESILITGGAGFIGSHLADELRGRGHEVRVLDSLVPQVHEGSGAADVVGDVRDPVAVKRALEGIDAVVHLAARVGVGQSMYEMAEYTSANSLGTAVLLEALAEKPVRKLVVASSMSIYGEGLYRGGEPGERDRAMLERREWDFPGLEPMPTPETKTPA